MTGTRIGPALTRLLYRFRDVKGAYTTLSPSIGLPSVVRPLRETWDIVEVWAGDEQISVGLARAGLLVGPRLDSRDSKGTSSPLAVRMRPTGCSGPFRRRRPNFS